MSRRSSLRAHVGACALIALAALGGVSRAGDPPPAPEAATLLARARQVAAAVGQAPRWPADLFDDAFRRNVPADELTRLLAATWAAEGDVTAVLPVGPPDSSRGRFEMTASKGGAFWCDLRLGDAPDRPIRYLRTYGSVPAWPDLPPASAALEELPGRVSFEVRRLDGERPETLASARADAGLAVASAAKLYVLGALVEEIRAGRRAWTDLVALDPALRSLPTGRLHRWPAGAPVTLHTLATLMIEESDNTATDHLLALVGRDRVEACVGALGHTHPERNVPFLATGEYFRLVYGDGGRHAAAWATLDASGRRDYLARVVTTIPLDRVDSPTGRAPRALDTIGWFASARDLGRAMDGLRRATETGPAAVARDLLAVGSGTTDPPDVFPYQGYKGGRLPGIASRTWLLRDGRGRWVSVSGTWNRADADVDEPRFVRMLTRVLQLLARAP